MSPPAAQLTTGHLTELAREQQRPAALRGFLEQALARPRRRNGVLVLSLPAPPLPPETALRALRSALPAALRAECAVLWAPEQGAAFAGLGCARRLALHGPERFADLRRQAAELFAQLDEIAHPDAAVTEPRLFGGLAFDVGGAAGEPWQDFGDGSFLLPRVRYACQDATATLSLALPADDPASAPFSPEGITALLAALEQAAALPLPPRPTSQPAGTAPRRLPGQLRQLPPERWREQVEAIRAAIHAGRCAKIVAPRRAELELPAAPDPIVVLERLASGNAAFGTIRFAFLHASGCFLGATPERLISRRGRQIETEALAGSAGLGEAEAQRLLASPKEQDEHALVVQHIVERLAPLCQQLDWSRSPRLRQLRNVVHLQTPIRGELRQASHVLDLVEVLHPTPAVGGVPVATALRWIAAHEATPRGWYAGPVGWFNAAGDGDFAVALRSCLLHASTAFVYAGAGIVADSDPEQEYLETALKQQTILSALGDRE